MLTVVSSPTGIGGTALVVYLADNRVTATQVGLGGALARVLRWVGWKAKAESELRSRKVGEGKAHALYLSLHLGQTLAFTAAIGADVIGRIIAGSVGHDDVDE